MVEKFQFDLVGPERLLVSSQVDSVIVPGAEGEFQVLNMHAPFMCILRPGVLTVEIDNEESRFFVREGIADAGPDWLNVLVNKAIPLEELKAEDIAQQIQDAKEDLEDAKTDADKSKAETILSQLGEVQAVLGLD